MYKKKNEGHILFLNINQLLFYIQVLEKNHNSLSIDRVNWIKLESNNNVNI